MIELKPCPFCGQYPLLREEDGEWKIECIGKGCECLPSTWWYDAKKEAIEALNRRAKEHE